MPLVYACICPSSLDVEAARTAEALRRVAGELAPYEAETALLVTSGGPGQRQAFGVVTAQSVVDATAGVTFETDRELADAVVAEAAKSDLSLRPVRRWDGGLDTRCGALSFLRSALSHARLLLITTCLLEPRFHFELGRAIGRALARYDRRVAVVCCAELSRALFPGAPGGYDPAGKLFDGHYRRAIEAWDVKWLTATDATFRRHAAEDAVAQTAVLMGALSGSRIQPRVLSYEGGSGVGRLVAAIDVLGPRKKEKAN